MATGSGTISVRRDHFLAKPGDVLNWWPAAAYWRRTTGLLHHRAQHLLRWTEKVTSPGEYKVTLKSGSSIARSGSG
jgi:hypothetical protein